MVAATVVIVVFVLAVAAETTLVVDAALALITEDQVAT